MARKAKAVEIKFTDVKPTEEGLYWYRKDRRFKHLLRFERAYVYQNELGLYAMLDGVPGSPVDLMKGQFSQRFTVK